MFLKNSERMLRLNLQFFGDEGGEGATVGGETAGNAASANSENNAGNNGTALSSEDIQKMIQSTVDSRTAELGKTISTLKKENEQLKKANMSAEERQKAERDEFEAQKAELEHQKREMFAHKLVAKAGFDGDDVQDIVDIVLSGTDDDTSDKLTKFTALVDKIAAKKVDKLYADNGRDPKASHTTTDTEKTVNIAEKLGKQTAEANKQAQDVLNHYLGGNR